MTQSCTDIGDELYQLVHRWMHLRQVQRSLPGMLDRSTHAGQQQRAARDRLHPGTRLGGPAISRPPVVHQRHGPGAALAALVVLGREATPAPLVFQLIKTEVDPIIKTDLTVV